MSKVFNHPDLKLTHEGRISTLWLDRGEQRNALNQSMLDQMADVFQKPSDYNPEVRCLVLRAVSPGPFCAGADLGEFERAVGDKKFRQSIYRSFRACYDSLIACPVPTLAVIEKGAYGGGFGLALAADLRIAERGAKMGLTPAKLGLLYPYEDMRRLVALAGVGVARDLILTARLINAEEAQTKGLITYAVGKEKLEEKAESLSRQISIKSPASHAGNRQFLLALEQSRQMDRATEMFLEAYDSDDFQEGLKAFREKRDPEF